MPGRLIVIATPIGNLEDLSPRARRELSEADLWLVEDTRVTGKLQAVLGVKKPMRVLNDHVSPRLVADFATLASEQQVALVSDAGTPIVSDPGAELVEACASLGVEIDVIPGPSAVTTALGFSGFYAQRFAFLGFLSRKAGQAAEALGPFADSALTLVLFESPFRIEATLKACHQALGSRRYVLCRELTKRHQQIWRGTLPEVPTDNEVTRKGEVTIVVEGRRRNQP